MKKMKVFISVFLSLVFVFSGITAVLANAIDFADPSFVSNKAPDVYTVRASNQKQNANYAQQNSGDADVLLIQDNLPWDSNTNKLILDSLDVSYDIVSTDKFTSADLSDYGVIILANDQSHATYEKYYNFTAYLEIFARAGGVVIYGACDNGWAGGSLSDSLPGGVTKYAQYANYNTVSDSQHKIVTGELTDGHVLTNADLYGNYASHTCFNEETLPEDSNVIFRSSINNAPTLVEYSLGDGVIIASGMTWEHNYVYHGNKFSRIAMDDMFKYALYLKKEIDKNAGGITTLEVMNKNVSFYIKDYGTGNTELNFDSKYFKNDSIVYNHSLARLCSQFVMMGYSSESSVKKALQALNINKNDIEINLDCGRDEVNYFIASRDITVNGEVYKLIFTAFIGSHKKQWNSNFDPLGLQNNNDDNLDEAYITHLGFADARDFVYDKLEKYCEKHLNGVDKSKIKILVSGHSRGAATSNLVAAKLIDEEKLALAKNIYTYAFATPNSTSNPDRTLNKYKRIFNFVNPEDFVTKVLPASWGFGRYGITFTLPSKTNDDEYSKYLSGMRKVYKEVAPDGSYKPYKDGEKNTYKIVKEYIDFMGANNATEGLNNFYNYEKVGEILTVEKNSFEYFQDVLCPHVNGERDILDYVVMLGGTIGSGSNVFDNLTRYFVGYANGIVSDTFHDSHDAHTYCSYILSMSALETVKPRKSYLNTVNCPVDIEVYDKTTGELVGSIINNVVDAEVAAKDNAVVMDVEGDSKTFWLPASKDYEVKLIGNDNGTMDYTVGEINCDSVEENRNNFFNVEVEKGKVLIGDYEKLDFELSEYTLKDEKGSLIYPTEQYNDNYKKTYKIYTSSEGKGTVSEPKTVVSGDYVILTATPKKGVEFFGWYENDNLISKEENYCFVAKEDRTFVAKFAKISSEPDVSDEILLNYRDSYFVDVEKILNIPEDMDYTIEYKLYDKSIADVIKYDSGFYVYANGRGYTDIEAIITLENGEVYLIEYEVTVSYAWWQWLIIIFLFGWIWY